MATGLELGRPLTESAGPNWLRRGHMEIIAEILEIASRGHATKTSLVYKANLNFTLIQRYLEHLERRGMIRAMREDTAMTYHLTIKGEETLALLKKAMGEVLQSEQAWQSVG